MIVSCVISLAIFYLANVYADCDSCGSYGRCIEYNEVNSTTVNVTCHLCACPTGINSTCCDDPTPCDPNPCGNNSSCVPNGALNYWCVCNSGFTGENCTEEVMYCDTLTTICGPTTSTASSFTSSTSSFTSSSSQLSTTGSNSSSTTTSDEWSSTSDICNAYTESTICSDCIHGNLECKNNGTCGWNGNGSLCDCPWGYSGDSCETKEGCADTPCLNGGTCFNINITDYECGCLSLYNNTDCDYYDPCNASPCKHGECINTADGEFYCNCTTGYNGTYCDGVIDYCEDNPCEYNGTCTSYVGYYDCDCPDGAYGTNCENLTDNCAVSNSTSNSTTICNSRDSEASCTNSLRNYTCTCSAEWAGRNCSIPINIWNLLQYFDDKSNSVAAFLESISGDPQAIQKSAAYVVATLNMGNLSEAGWKLEETIIWAAFEQREFNASENFYTLTDATIGNCFTFNHKKSAFTFKLRNSGETNGLSMLTKVNEQEYIPWLDIAMMSVYVHPFNTLVFAESLSFDAIPGAISVLRVSKSTYTRLGGHFGACTKKPSDVKAYFYQGNYSTDACLWSCYQVQVNESCGCMDPRYQMPKKGALSCGLTDANCVFNVTDALGDPSTWDTCDCPTECEGIQYDVQWDGAGFVDSPVECSSLENDTTAYQNCITELNDYARIVVYFPDITQTTYAESAKWTINSLMAYFGGLVGAVMGFSFVSVIEIAFLFYRCVLVMCTNESATLEEVDVGGMDEDEQSNGAPAGKVRSLDLVEKDNIEIATDATQTSGAEVKPEKGEKGEIPPQPVSSEPVVAPVDPGKETPGSAKPTETSKGATAAAATSATPPAAAEATPTPAPAPAASAASPAADKPPSGSENKPV
ncbi:unnamed protein product [Bursaphelenchus xylophilus]|uniref:(pine wood nematode) hypothetical protein n=1 Tax=Bursaphelenchus xylophilus TaxID=6326 RepID=A0A1I7RPQ7_BURXY|nr:unnamed protein product [Bursaphelenchus xylophilus]CAG9096454.1 unnamed protein product [Bursaphelenchus xylophilus]